MLHHWLALINRFILIHTLPYFWGGFCWGGSWALWINNLYHQQSKRLLLESIKESCFEEPNVIRGWSPNQTPIKHRCLFKPLAAGATVRYGRNPLAIYCTTWCIVNPGIPLQSPRCFGWSVYWERELDYVYIPSVDVYIFQILPSIDATFFEL